MKLQMHSVHFDADRKLLSFIQERADKLDLFYDRITEGEVFLRLNNEGIKNKTVEIKLMVPGAILYSSENAGTFEVAADEAIEALRQQIKKYKEKQKAHH